MIKNTEIGYFNFCNIQKRNISSLKHRLEEERREGEKRRETNPKQMTSTQQK